MWMAANSIQLAACRRVHLDTATVVASAVPSRWARCTLALGEVSPQRGGKLAGDSQRYNTIRFLTVAVSRCAAQNKTPRHTRATTSALRDGGFRSEVGVDPMHVRIHCLLFGVRAFEFKTRQQPALLHKHSTFANDDQAADASRESQRAAFLQLGGSI